MIHDRRRHRRTSIAAVFFGSVLVTTAAIARAGGETACACDAALPASCGCCETCGRATSFRERIAGALGRLFARRHAAVTTACCGTVPTDGVASTPHAASAAVDGLSHVEASAGGRASVEADEVVSPAESPPSLLPPAARRDRTIVGKRRGPRIDHGTDDATDALPLADAMRERPLPNSDEAVAEPAAAVEVVPDDGIDSRLLERLPGRRARDVSGAATPEP